MAFTGLAIAAAAALAKNELVDKPAAARQRKLAAATQAYSPWTGLKADAVQDPNALGQMIQYGAAGASMGQGMENADAANKLAGAQADRLNTGGSLGGGWGGGYGKDLTQGAAPVSGLQYNQPSSSFWKQNPWGG